MFDKCTKTERKLMQDEKGGYYMEEVHYKYDFIEDFQDLFMDKGSKVLIENDEAQDVSGTDEFIQRRRGEKNFDFKLLILYSNISLDEWMWYGKNHRSAS